MSTRRGKRDDVLAKSGGRCWYCGVVLPERGWHVDHAVPVWRGTGIRRGTDDLSNLVPACAPCNLYKATHSIEQFRREIAAQVERARRSSVNFRTAERFGLVEAKDQPVLFWFERERKVEPR